MNSTNREIAMNLTYKICSSAAVADYNRDLKGANEAIEYRAEFMNYLYPLVDFDDEVVFITAKELSKVSDTCTAYFIGKYVKIYMKPDWTGFTYFVSCMAPSKLLGTCYSIARRRNFTDY